jgi:hypothetical protein
MNDTEPKLVTVEEWAAIERKRIAAYVRYWKKELKENPEQYVEKMPLGEWDEDYAMFDGS